MFTQNSDLFTQNYLKMEKNKYRSILRYLDCDILPETYTSTKGNFIVMANQFEVNAKNRLMCEGKLVLRAEEIPQLFKEMHCK